MKLFGKKLAHVFDDFDDFVDKSTHQLALSQKTGKFDINVNEVFGPEFVTKDIITWLSNKPIETFDWLKLPYPATYFEFHHWNKTLTGKDTVGLLATHLDGAIHMNTLLFHKKQVVVMPYIVVLGIEGELGPSHFKSMAMYKQWKEIAWNTTNRFDVRTMTSWGNTPDHIALTSEAVGFAVLLLETLLYINAKGVGTVVNTFRPKSKSLRRKASSTWTYKTLRLVNKGEAKEVVNKTKRSIPFTKMGSREHTVRGHIAVYTKERPLFGNPKNVGPIWISPHTRCKGTEGKVIKEYEVL